VVLTVGPVAFLELSTPRGPVRVLAEGALVLGTCVMTLLWIRSNRVALDLTDWCDCATTTVRVIGASTGESGAPGGIDDELVFTLPDLRERILHDRTDEVEIVGSGNEALANRGMS
jgi:hypothetical protein